MIYMCAMLYVVHLKTIKFGQSNSYQGLSAGKIEDNLAIVQNGHLDKYGGGKRVEGSVLWVPSILSALYFPILQSFKNR